MRDGSRGVSTSSASLTIAVDGRQGQTDTAKDRLKRAGYEVVVVPEGFRHVKGRALVVASEEVVDPFAVIRPTGTTTSLTLQPIWSVYPAMAALGYELLVADDDDATAQLDVFYEVFECDLRPQGMRRSHITICPRNGWQGYGFSSVTMS